MVASRLLQFLLVVWLGGCGATPLPPMTRFGDTDCLSCLQTGCSSELRLCGEEPECAGRFTCILACPVSATGNADTGCEKDCENKTPLPSGPAQRAADVLHRCRYAGSGTLCACGIPAVYAGSNSPILHQKCPGMVSAQQTCSQCGDVACCDSVQRYKQDPQADMYRTCIMSCPDNPHDAMGQPIDKGNAMMRVSCLLKCRTDYASGELLYQERALCAGNKCGSQCGVSANPCNACLIALCIDPTLNCYTNRDCLSIVDCTNDCRELGIDTPACWQSCQQRFPAGANLFLRVQLCLITECEPIC
jgi:hypothetical protein